MRLAAVVLLTAPQGWSSLTPDPLQNMHPLAPAARPVPVQIVSPSDSAVASPARRLAALELRRYLHVVAGLPSTIVTEPTPAAGSAGGECAMPTIWLLAAGEAGPAAAPEHPAAVSLRRCAGPEGAEGDGDPLAPLRQLQGSEHWLRACVPPADPRPPGAAPPPAVVVLGGGDDAAVLHAAYRFVEVVLGQYPSVVNPSAGASKNGTKTPIIYRFYLSSGPPSLG
jgi:hypothetical protein